MIQILGAHGVSHQDAGCDRNSEHGADEEKQYNVGIGRRRQRLFTQVASNPNRVHRRV